MILGKARGHRPRLQSRFDQHDNRLAMDRVIRIHHICAFCRPEVSETLSPWSCIDEPEPASARTRRWDGEPYVLVPHVHKKDDVVIADGAAIDAPMETSSIRPDIGNCVFALEPIRDVVSLIQSQVAK